MSYYPVTASWFGSEFVLTGVYRFKLGFIVANFYHAEGCQSMQELIDIWAGLHPRRPADPDQRVWVHQFMRVLQNGSLQCPPS